ncbi:hypothetical protein QOV31_004874 (plasmid) [Agrobacterium fabrum]|jgi:hypothetical protein|nr:hypothetical protein [Agrobacterium fabrum]WJK77990.1 hypothetical protein QOV31_004874 [Agrobacterium fabrum]CAD0216971.1 hypothetical protein AGTUEHA105_LOCUS4900 [Agrobacterium tumefaciens]
MEARSRRHIMPWRDCFPGVRSDSFPDSGGGSHLPPLIAATDGV